MKRILVALSTVTICSLLLLGCDCKEEGEGCTEDDDCCSDNCVFYSPYDSLGYCK